MSDRFADLLREADNMPDAADRSKFLQGPVTRFLQTDPSYTRGSPEILEDMKAVIGRLRPSEAGEYARDTFKRELQFGLEKGRIGQHEAAKVLSNLEERFVSPAVAKSALNEIVGEVAQHADGFANAARRFGAGGKIFAAAVGAAVAGATGANASEIGEAGINAAAPGLGTLVLGQGPSKTGVMCKAFGEAAGVVVGTGAGFAAGVGVSAVATPLVGAGVGIGVGMGTEAAVTPTATAACNAGAKLLQKLGF